MARRIIAIDPGPDESAYVLFDKHRHYEQAAPRQIPFGMEDNATLRVLLGMRPFQWDHLVIEEIVTYGKPAPKTILDAVFWSGRFVEAAGLPCTRISAPSIKTHLCGRAFSIKKENIACALYDLYGGKKQAVGRKKAPGPLYGLNVHTRDALALAITWWERNHEREVSSKLARDRQGGKGQGWLEVRALSARQ